MNVPITTVLQLIGNLELMVPGPQAPHFLAGPCPLCKTVSTPEKGEGLFLVNTLTNTFSCGICEKSGGVVDFVSAFTNTNKGESEQLLMRLIVQPAHPVTAFGAWQKADMCLTEIIVSAVWLMERFKREDFQHSVPLPKEDRDHIRTEAEKVLASLQELKSLLELAWE